MSEEFDSGPPISNASAEPASGTQARGREPAARTSWLSDLNSSRTWSERMRSELGWKPRQPRWSRNHQEMVDLLVERLGADNAGPAVDGLPWHRKLGGDPG